MVHAILGIRPAPAPEGGRSCEDSDAAASDQDIADASAPDRAALREARRGVPQPTIDDLLFDLDEPDPNARVVAVPKVGSLRPRETIEVLSNVFSRDNDPLVRSRAIAALTRLGGSDASRLLRERALEDDDPGLRMQALNALASAAGNPAVNVLGHALRQDPEPKVGISALRALGRIGGSWARSSLKRAARDPDPQVRLAAEDSLAAWPAED